MRNFEGMPEKITIDAHLDIDLLVSDYYLAERILDGSSATQQRFDDGGYRILNYVNIGNEKVMFDLRSVGDNYYDTKMQRDRFSSFFFFLLIIFFFCIINLCIVLMIMYA